MTKDNFNKANALDKQIKHVKEIIDMLSPSLNYRLDPPTRMSGFELVKTATGSELSELLSEIDVVWIRETFEAKLIQLNAEFDAL